MTKGQMVNWIGVWWGDDDGAAVVCIDAWREHAFYWAMRRAMCPKSRIISLTSKSVARTNAAPPPHPHPRLPGGLCRR